jgi:hypothetical protein
MRIIVSDSSALIDLHKGGILELLFKLPFEFVIPDALIESELLSFTKRELNHLRKQMTVAILDGQEVERAQAIVASAPALSLIDGFALVVAEKNSGCILLTGDKRMRLQAESSQIECHGVLWVVEELFTTDGNHAKSLLSALQAWVADPFVHLPNDEIKRLIDLIKD